MRKRDKHKWHKRTHCKTCNGYATKGGRKVWILRFTEWSNPCRCTRYNSNKPTELDRKRCEEVLKEQEDKKNDTKTNN